MKPVNIAMQYYQMVAKQHSAKLEPYLIRIAGKETGHHILPEIKKQPDYGLWLCLSPFADCGEEYQKMFSFTLIGAHYTVKHSLKVLVEITAIIYIPLGTDEEVLEAFVEDPASCALKGGFMCYFSEGGRELPVRSVERLRRL